MIFRFSGSVCVSNVVKKIGLIAGLLCSLVSLVANNPIANRFVKIGGLTNNFPYSYANINDKLDGFSYDLSEAVMHYLHLKHEFKLYDLTYTLNHTEHHYNDLILSECDLSMISVMPSIDSGKYYNSIPYCQLNSYIISKKGAVFKEINDVMGKKLIIPKNCLFKERLSYFNSNHVEEISPVLFTSLGIKMVADGKVDYMLIDDLALHEFWDNIEKYNLVLSPLEGNTFDLCFSSENKELIEEVNGAIQELKSNGTIGFLHDKWFYKKENKLSYLYGVLCFLLLLLAVMLIIIYILRKVLKVNKRDVDTAQAHNEELSIVLNILMKNSNIEIYMFEEPTKNLFILKDGSFVPSGVNLGEVETRIHPDDLEQYNGDYIKVISGQVNYLISTLRIYNVETKAYRYYELAVVPSEKNDGKMVTAYYYSLRDVTDVMKDLQEKEETIGSFNLALRSVNLIRWKYDIKKETIKLLYTDSKYKEMPLNTFLCAISWEDRELFMQYINNVIQENEMEDIIMRMMLTNEEEYRIYNISSNIQWDRNGRPENIYGIVNDITEITKYNHKVEELRKGMQMALDAGKVSTWRFDKEKNTVYILYGHHLTGGIMTMEEYYSYVHADDKEVFPSALDSILKGEADNLEVNFRLNPSGNGYRWYSCCLMPVYEDKEIKYVIGTRRDVTEDIDYRIELEENHKILQNILDKVPTPVYIVDPELDTVVYANNQCEAVFGIKKGVNSGMVYRRDLSKICIAKNIDLLRTGGDYSANELLVFRNGEIRYTHVNKIVIAFNNKNLILTARVDLTEQEQLSIAKKLITVSLPGFNAYTWSVDGRNNKMYYNVLGGNNVANINHIDTIDEFTSLIHTEDRESCKQTLSSYIKKGEGEFCMIYRIRYGDNESYQWWETRGIAELLEDKNGKHTVLYGISINITSQKLNELSLKESQMKLLEINRQNELILNNSSSGIVYVDCDGKVLWSNLLSVEGLCFPITEFYSGCGCEHFLGCNKMCHECPIKVHNNSGEVWCREIDLEDNGIFNILATPIKGEHGVEGTVLRIDNITERAMMISDLEAAKEKAEESERLKMAFLANMSHEIRTPLNAIVGFSELLQETVDENEKKEFINIINYNNDLLLRLIGDILDLSKIESGTIDLKLDEFDFSLALREQYHSWQQRDCDNGIEFIFEDPYESCVISHDKNRLIQVCMNFLSNAFKYTKYGTITLGYIYENGGLKMYVKDTGIGIASNKHHLIFNRFAKLDDFAQGTGLGLTICKAIVETCGGKIGFESKQNVGSYFWAWFPCQAKEIVDNKMGRKLQMDSETENVVDKINLSNNMHILVAEDNESNYLLVKAILKNYNITRVNNGADAVKCARENTYDAILMDVNMPIMSGIEATQKIRLFNPTIPIIAFTANAFDADRYAARAAGFSAFIAKPIRKKQLERTLSRITEISIVDCDDYWE